jgi:acetyl esterase
MPLHPQAQNLCDVVNAMGGAAASDEQLQQARDGLALLTSAGAGDPEPVAHVEDRTIAGPHGDVPVRIYRPGDDGGLPVLVWLHGGGWTLGSVESHDPITRVLANGAGCVVVSVDYRLAPEHPFPAPLDDCWAALQWVSEHAAEIGGDAARLAIGGDSAGANLAAVCALLARDAGAPAVALQVLVYPVIDHGFTTESYRENGSGFVLEERQMRWFYDCYTRGGADPADWRISPLQAESLAGVAPALVVTAEFDPLRDEGEAYADALRAAGVPASTRRFDGMIHAFFGLPAAFDDAKAAFDEVHGALRTAFGTVTRAGG